MNWVLAIVLCLATSCVYSQSYPDYFKLKYWHAHPAVEDASDKSPFNTSSIYKKIDVFYVHPTSYTNGRTHNASLNKQALSHKIDIHLLNQASVFSGLANVYAPAYREVRFNLFIRGDDEKRIPAIERAYADVKASFQHYLNEWNRGNAIIIAAHGQGSMHAQRLLAEFFDSTHLDQLIVAYLPGYVLPDSIFKSTFRNLVYCSDSAQVGCITSWQTYGKFVNFQASKTTLNWNGTSYINNLDTNRLCANPLIWNANVDSLFALETRALRPSMNKRIPLRMETYTASATVNRGHLLVYGENRLLFNSTGDNHHAFDYNLFYENIHTNAALRIETHQKRKSEP